MTSKLTYMGIIGLAAFSSVAATPAFAAGTTAGTTITNTATVDFQVGGVSQVQQSASNNFTVDRKINLLVEEVGTVTTNVVPGQANAVTTFQLTNSSNEVLDFALAASQITGGTAAHGGTDTFDATNIRIYRDNTSSGTRWQLGRGRYARSPAISTSLSIDTAIRLFVVADIPTGLANNAVAGVTLRRHGARRRDSPVRRGNDHRNHRREYRGQGYRLCRHRWRNRRRRARCLAQRQRRLYGADGYAGGHQDQPRHFGSAEQYDESQAHPGRGRRILHRRRQYRQRRRDDGPDHRPGTGPADL